MSSKIIRFYDNSHNKAVFVFAVDDNNKIIKLHVNYSTLLYNKESATGKSGCNKMPSKRKCVYLSLAAAILFTLRHRVGAFGFEFQW